MSRQAPKITFGSWLTTQMQAYGYESNMALAEKLGVRDPTVGRWRKDASVPDIPQLRRIAVLFNTPLPRLLVLAGHMTEEELGVGPPQPAPRPVDPLVERIDQADVSDQTKAQLRDIWAERLRSERSYMQQLVDAYESV